MKYVKKAFVDDKSRARKVHMSKKTQGRTAENLNMPLVGDKGNMSKMEIHIKKTNSQLQSGGQKRNSERNRLISPKLTLISKKLYSAVSC